MKKSLADHLLDWSGRIFLTAILGFLVLPFFVVAIASFNKGAILSFPPEAWSVQWYVNAFEYRDFGAGLRNSLRIAAIGAGIALIAGAGFAYVFQRYEFRCKSGLNAILMSPLIIPNFTIGLGILILTASASLPRNLWTVVTVHVIIVLPFVVRSVYVSLQNLERNYENAAESLGASPAYVLLTITAPLLLPGLIAGAYSQRSCLSTNSPHHCMWSTVAPPRCPSRCITMSGNTRTRHLLRFRSCMRWRLQSCCWCSTGFSALKGF